MSEQLQFGFFACLDFEGRVTLSVREVALRLGYTTRHVIGWIESGELAAFDGRGTAKATRAAWRIPIDAYRDFVRARITGPGRQAFLAALPKATLRELLREIQTLLRKAA